MIEPNRLHVPGERAARERVEAVFARIDELSPVELANVMVSPPDAEERDALRAVLDRAAGTRGLGPLLGEARRATRDALLARLSSELPAGVYAARVRDSGRAEDRAALIAAIEDAVAAAVAEDVADADVAEALSEPGRSVLGLPPLRLTRASDGRPHDGPASGPASALRWEPSARDWDEATRVAPEGRELAQDTLLPGVRGMWLTFVTVAGVSGVVAALAWGVATSERLLGVLVALAVAAVAWTLATFRRPA